MIFVVRISLVNMNNGQKICASRQRIWADRIHRIDTRTHKVNTARSIALQVPVKAKRFVLLHFGWRRDGTFLIQWREREGDCVIGFRVPAFQERPFQESQPGVPL
jgi:hypothetical protein